MKARGQKLMMFVLKLHIMSILQEFCSLKTQITGIQQLIMHVM